MCMDIPNKSNFTLEGTICIKIDKRLRQENINNTVNEFTDKNFIKEYEQALKSVKKTIKHYIKLSWREYFDLTSTYNNYLDIKFARNLIAHKRRTDERGTYFEYSFDKLWVTISGFDEYGYIDYFIDFLERGIQMNLEYGACTIVHEETHLVAHDNVANKMYIYNRNQLIPVDVNAGELVKKNYELPNVVKKDLE